MSSDKIVLLLLLTPLFLFFNSYVIAGDGTAYYAVTDSLVSDFDLNLTNQHKFLREKTGIIYNEEKGFFTSFANPGLPIASAIPLSISKSTKIDFMDEVFLKVQGVPIKNTLFLNLLSNAYGLLTLLLCYKILKKFEIKKRVLILLSCFLSTPLFFHSSYWFFYTHSLETLLLTVALFIFIFYPHNKKTSFLLGAVFSFLTLTKYTNFMFFLVFLSLSLTARKKHAAHLILGYLSLIWLIPTYVSASGQSYTGFSFPTNLFNVFISPLRGLFVWSPLVILSVFPHKKKFLWRFFVISLIVFGLFYGSWHEWYGGMCFGQRFFTSFYSFFTLGLGFFLKRIRYNKKVMASLILLTVYSFLLMLFWIPNVIDRESGTPFDIFRADFGKALSRNISYFYSRLVIYHNFLKTLFAL